MAEAKKKLEEITEKLAAVDEERKELQQEVSRRPGGFQGRVLGHWGAGVLGRQTSAECRREVWGSPAWWLLLTAGGRHGAGLRDGCC